MIKLEKIFVLLFLLGLSVRMSAVGLDKRFQILPLPQQMEIQKGKGISAGELSFVTMKGEGEIPVLGNMLDALPRYECTGPTKQYVNAICPERTIFLGIAASHEDRSLEGKLCSPPAGLA